MNTRWEGDFGEPIRYLEEQLVIAEVTDAFFDRCDEREIGYPEKLVWISQRWDLSSLIRGGPRLQSPIVFPDDHLLRWAKGLEGRNAHHFEMVATPRRTLAWAEAVESADYTLLGNEAWRTLFRQYFEEIEKEHPGAIVTARIYNPCDLMKGLYRLAKLQTGDTLPTAELVVSLANESPARVVFGALVWNGHCVRTLREVLPDEMSTLFDLYMAGAIDGGPWAAEEHLVAQHGLEYDLVEGELISGEITWRRLIMDSGTMQRVEVGDRRLESFCHFYEAHQHYLEALVRDFDSWAFFG
jgi:hypothetical protein